jgi:mycofactocin glycosyltransferase
MPRPPVDIVLPFVGTDAALSALVDTVSVIELGPDDTFTIADNRPDAAPGERQAGHITIRGAAGQPSSYFARNRGAEGGSNPWLIFIDADVEPSADLVDAYFTPLPGPQDGVLIGGIFDREPGPDATAVERHSFTRGAVSHTTTLHGGEFDSAQTANAGVLREAFEAVGGFTEGIRSGGDTDLCFRIRDAGYALVPRFDARVEHRNRTSLKAYVRVYARYGSGSAWLNRRYRGFSPTPNPAYVAAAIGYNVLRAGFEAVRGRRDAAAMRLLTAARRLASVSGRFMSNEVAPHPAPGLRTFKKATTAAEPSKR